MTPSRPVVCFDETSSQLLRRRGRRSRLGLAPRLGLDPPAAGLRVPAGGHAQPVYACEPLAGWRQVAVTQRRTMQDFAHQMRWLVDEAYPEVPVVRVVLDNLNTHRTASLYETFPAAEARGLRNGWSSTTPQAWQLAEHGGDRVQRAVPLLPQEAPGR